MTATANKQRRMKQISKQTLLEQIVYLIIWIFIGVAPIVSTYSAQNTLPDHTTVWKDIMQPVGGIKL